MYVRGAGAAKGLPVARMRETMDRDQKRYAMVWPWCEEYEVPCSRLMLSVGLENPFSRKV